MVELKFKRLACNIDPKSVFFEVKTAPIRICKIDDKDYLIIGSVKDCKKVDREILTLLFGDEVVYSKHQVLVPRNFFFI